MSFIYKSLSIVAIICSFVNSSELIDFYNPQNSCDYLIITPRAFVDGAKELADYRNQNKEDDVTNAMYIVLENLINQGGYAGADTLLHNALLWTTGNWKLSPKYVVFIGDDSAICHEGDSVFINHGPMPSHLDGRINTYFTEDERVHKDTTIQYSDTWYTYEADNPMLFAFGRIPCETPLQLHNYIQKVKMFEKRTPGAWMNKCVMFADDKYQDNLPDPINHEEIPREVCNRLPDMFSECIYFSDFPKSENRIDAAKNTFFSAVNKGVNWVVLSAHGSPAFLTGERVLTAADYSLFSNSNDPMIVFSMSCSNGAFYNRIENSMSKSYLFAESGGAVTYIATPNIAFLNSNIDLISRICQAKDSNPQVSIGMLLYNAQVNSSYDCMAFEVLGDPAVHQKPYKQINCTVSFIDEKRAHCVIDSSTFEKGWVTWQVTKKNIDRSDPFCILERKSVLVSGVKKLTTRSFDLTIPDSILADSLRFSCFIWNDSMAGSAGCLFRNGADKVVMHKSHGSDVTAHTSIMNRQGILFSFTNVLYTPATAEMYNLNGRLLQKVNIPSGIKSYLFNCKEKQLFSAGISVILIRYGNAVITQKINGIR